MSSLDQQRETAANAVARWAGDSSPSPFNPRHSEFPEYLDLIFAVEDEAEHWVNNAPPEILDAAISLAQRPPDASWGGWGAFNGPEDWDYGLEQFLQLWAHRFPSQFGEKAAPLLENSATRALILGAMSDAASLRASPDFDATPFLAVLQSLLEAPQQLSTNELRSLYEILNAAKGSRWAQLWSRLSVSQQAEFESERQRLKKEWDFSSL